jgi:hypothetical protein
MATEPHNKYAPGAASVRMLYTQSITYMQENTMKELFGEEGVQTTPFGHGVPQRKPEDSVYYHPITNPTGMPPAGRPQRYKDDVELMDPAKAEKLEEERRARAAAAVSAATQQAKEQPANTAPANILPPPPGPPPGFLAPPAGPPPGVLPPPTGPPPGVLPPPAGPPPGVLPSPVGPPPSGIMPPPPGPLPGFPASGLQPAAGPFAGHLPTTSGAPQVSPTKQPTASVVAGEATAVRTIPAHQDPRLKAMVPATVRAKRQKFKSSTKLQPVPNLDVNAGFGLAPQLGATDTQDAGEAAYAEFMDEIAKME